MKKNPHNQKSHSSHKSQKLQEISLLKDSGMKNTPARRAMLEAFAHDHRPLTAEGVHAKLKNLDLVTIYRTLIAFEKSGIIKKIDLHSDSQHYELADASARSLGGHGCHHHHLVCTDCGKTEDFELCDVEAITKKVLKNSTAFRQVSEHSLELFGLCKACVQS